MQKGFGYCQKGDFGHAIKEFEQAEGVYNKEGDYEKGCNAQLKMALAYQYLGEYKKSLELLENACGGINEGVNPAQMAELLGILGEAYHRAGLKDKAVAALEQGLLLANKKNHIRIAAGILNNLGNLYASEGLYDKAASSYREAIALSKEAVDQALTANALANLGAALLKKGDTQGAIAALGQAFAAYISSTDSHNKGVGLVNIAQAYRRLSLSQPGLKRMAYDALKRAADAAEAIGDLSLIAYSPGYLGQIYEGEGRYDEALHLTRRALFAAQQAGAQESLYLWQWQTGRIFKGKGDQKKAIAAYREAVETLQSIRHGISGECEACGGSSFRESIEPVYFGLADLLLEYSETLQDKKERHLCLAEARNTIELLKTAEVRDYFQDQCLGENQAKIKALDSIADDTAIIYCIPFEDRLELLMSIPGGIKRFRIEVTREDLANLVKCFRKTLEKRTTKEYLRYAHTLYDLLIRPLELDLDTKKIRTLVFVPDGILRNIPMAALHNGTQFLIERFALASTLGLDLTDPRPIKRASIDTLLAGITEPVQGFPALDYVGTELRAINEIYAGTLLVNQELIVPNFKKELEGTPYNVVHIASHGEFKGESRESYILAWEGKLTMDHLDRFMRSSQFRKMPVELLMLSACQTAAGDDRAALGLAGVSVKAGARSAIATLWHVNDRACTELVVEFYRQLKDTSVSKAKALQLAQVKLLEDPLHRHPCYWSPFLMIGNWL